MQEHIKYSFAPVIDVRSLLLVLGTMPGEESLRRGQYYANSRNLFWDILSRVYGEPIGESYADRLRFLRAKRIALWDVLQSGEREGSLDSNIRGATPNDFVELIKTYPQLRAIAFNGGKASQLFHRWVARRLPRGSLAQITLIDLPSTSPTPGRYVLPAEQKVAQWRAISKFSNIVDAA